MLDTMLQTVFLFTTLLTIAIVWIQVRDLLDRKLTFDEFLEVNKGELACIFAETGMDKEPDFNYDMEVEHLYYNPGVWAGLKYERDDL